MTRVLSELLGAVEPQFSRNLAQLEVLAGHPNTDIRLTTELTLAARAKVHELGLDASDTTSHELYAGLGERLKADESRYQVAIGAADASDIQAAVARTLQKILDKPQCYGMKVATCKRLLRMQIPKKTMKQLGYRSVESLLKHESPAVIMAAAWLVEAPGWSKKLVASYSKLRPTDFELRSLTIEQPASKRWQEFADTVLARKGHIVSHFKELATVVLFPFPTAGQPQLAGLMSSVLTIQAANEVRAASSYLRLHQLQANFGEIVRQVVVAEPLLSLDGFGQPTSWHTLQQFFGRFRSVMQSDIFEPLVSLEDLVWHKAEHILSALEPSMEFWHDTLHLGRHDGTDVVSYNIFDQILSHANKLPFDQRSSHYFVHSLSDEIILRYMESEHLRGRLLTNLHQTLAPEMVVA